MMRPLDLLRCLARGAAEGLAAARRRRTETIPARRTPPVGVALLSTPTVPIDAAGKAEAPTASHWAWRQIAGVLLEHGYAVEVVSAQNRAFTPRRPYTVFVGAVDDFARLAPLLPGGCRRLLYLDDADVVFRNYAELERLVRLKDRRGPVLVARRHARLTPALEHATAAIVRGNEWTLSTYGHARIPLHRVPTVCLGEHPSPATKNVEACRRRFLWPGGYGLVRKGLDRVLEAFATSPELGLTVCGPVGAEPDFAAAYAAELGSAPNIEAVGSVDVRSRRYAEIARRCVALVLPSAAEGQADEVVAGMGAGLIPIVSRESGVDVDDGGVILDDCSVATVQEAVRELSSRPAEHLLEMAMTAWTLARARHAPAVVRARYRDLLAGILGAA